jgi:peptidyl-tRNA hydrolase
MGNYSYKMAFVVADYLGISRGKVAAQVGHGCVDMSLRMIREPVLAEKVHSWYSDGQVKIVLAARDERELMEAGARASDAGLYNGVVEDLGYNEVSAGSRTCVWIGPDKRERIDKVTGKLKLLA